MLRTVVFALTLNPSPKQGERDFFPAPLLPNLGEGAGDEGFFFAYGKNYSFQGGRGLYTAFVKVK
ncbi:hypothetical protein [Nostoc sp.]|uniref:hypothetical protein n=1 Tax=Nostoc sp. TaxID=1180 RepID=UPI002FF6BD0C